MSPERQLELDLSRDPGPRAHAGRLGRLARRAGLSLLGWLPALALAGVFAQVALLGLRPARAEARRLVGQEAVVRARETRLCAQHDLLQRQRAALADPVFQERVARARRSERYAVPPRPLDLPLSDGGR